MPAWSPLPLLQCPMCGAKDVRKQMMAPAVAGTKAQVGVDPPPPPFLDKGAREMMMQHAQAVRAHVEENFDYVGDAFAQEARDIHDGKSEERGIYGEASGREVRALIEDGVPVAPLPSKPPRKTEVN